MGTSSTIMIGIGTTMFSAMQVSTAAAIGALGALGLAAAGIGTTIAGGAAGLAGGAVGAAIGSVSDGRKRREVDQKEITLEMLVSIEPEDCSEAVQCRRGHYEGFTL